MLGVATAPPLLLLIAGADSLTYLGLKNYRFLQSILVIKDEKKVLRNVSQTLNIPIMS